MSHPDDTVRCPKCNALISAESFECPECIAMELHADVSDSKHSDYEDLLPPDGPTNPVLRFIWGLGMPYDVWVIAFLGIIWFFIHCIVFTFEHAIIWLSIGTIVPLFLMFVAGPASSVSFFRYNVQEVEPIAFRIFNWVLVSGVQIWLIYEITR